MLAAEMEVAPKAWLAEALYRTGLLRWLRWGAGGRLLVFNYHRIRPDDPEFSTPLDEGVYGPRASVFDRQVAWLCRHTRVLSESDLLDLLGGASPPRGLSSLITFDDGYADNFELALPILARHGARAIFFIPTGMIEDRKLGWWDAIAYLVKMTTVDKIDLTGKSYPTADRAGLIGRLYGKMTGEPAASTTGLVARLEEACRVALPDAAFQSAQFMTWEQIRELHARGMAVGSHTHSHAVLATLDDEQQRVEMALSKQVLEERLGAPVRTLAYPVGHREHFTRESMKLAADCGYGAAFSFATGGNRWPTMDRYAIARVSAPASLALLMAKAQVPGFFAAR